jgi:hypothetical protein
MKKLGIAVVAANARLGASRFHLCGWSTRLVFCKQKNALLLLQVRGVIWIGTCFHPSKAPGLNITNIANGILPDELHKGAWESGIS